MRYLRQLGSSSALVAISVLLWGQAAAGAPADGAELRDLPQVQSVDVDGPPSACDVHVPGEVVKARLIVRNTPRAIGPYNVNLPGYATGENATTDFYGPYEIDARPGDLLRIDLVNELNDGETIPAGGFSQNSVKNANDKTINLHTHGLIVDPQPYRPCGDLGDNVFEGVDWKATAHYDIAIPVGVPHGYFGAPSVPGLPPDKDSPYPVGPYWIHSHLHGQAKPSVLAGQSAFLLLQCREGASLEECPDWAKIYHVAPKDVKPMALRDLQVLVPRYLALDQKPPQNTTALAAGLNGFSYDTSACVAPSGTPKPDGFASGGGWCQAPSNVAYIDANGAVQPNPAGAAAPSNPANVAWMFTINGQLFPTVTLSADSPRKIWRLANMSAVATYRLRLVEKKDGNILNVTPLTVLSVDGVLAGEEKLDSKGMTQIQSSKKSNELVLMPGARAEVMVDWSKPPQDVSLTLETEGFCTGYNLAGDCSADPWPQIDLAKVLMKAPPPATSPTGGPFVSQEMKTASPEMAEAEKISRRVVEISQEASESIPSNCLKMPKAGYRTIRFEQDVANFFIGPFDTDSADLGDRLKEVRSFRHEHSPGMRPHICVESGKVELWLLENDTPELHNFHIHQTRFRLANVKEMQEHHIAGQPVQDPAGLFQKNKTPGGIAPLLAEAETQGAVWHDSIPVPPAKDDKTPGRVAIVIPFLDPHQVGTFVYHCHILEHEDGGMMGVVEVYKKDQVKAGSLAPPGVRKAGFCGEPPAGYEPPTTPEPDWRHFLRAAFNL